MPRQVIAVVPAGRHHTRYRLLDTMRAYAAEQLNAANEVAAMHDRHLRYFSTIGIPVEEVDGQDVRAVYEATARLVATARRGETPGFLHALTYRYRGHHVGDVDRRYYRSKEEEDEWQLNHDPMRTLANWLLLQEVADEATLERIHETVHGEIDRAVQFAIDAPFPPPEEVSQHVYA